MPLSFSTVRIYNVPYFPLAVLQQPYTENKEKSEKSDLEGKECTFDSPRVSFSRPDAEDEAMPSWYTKRRKLAYPSWDNAAVMGRDDEDQHTIVTNATTTPDRGCPPSVLGSLSPLLYFPSPTGRMAVGHVQGRPALMSPIHRQGQQQHYRSSATGGEVGSGSDGDSRKAGPRMWTLEEDQILLQAVKSSPQPVKWPVVAQNISERTGKQVRAHKAQIHCWLVGRNSTVFSNWCWSYLILGVSCFIL